MTSRTIFRSDHDSLDPSPRQPSEPRAAALRDVADAVCKQFAAAGALRGPARHGGGVSAPGGRNAITRAKVVAALEAAGEASVTRLCHVARLSDTTIYRHVGELHQAGQVHIVRWVLSSGKFKPPEAIYRLGPGVDAINPKPPDACNMAWMKKKRRIFLDTPGTLPAPRPLGPWGLSW